MRARHGALNALINNAGRAPRVRADLLEATEESFEELMRTNLQGPYFLTQAVARDMVARRKSRPGVPRRDRLRHVGLGRDGVAQPRRVLREQGGPRDGGQALRRAARAVGNLPVYEVRPGIISTDMTAGVRQIYDQRIADGLVPEQRWGQPEDVGRAVATLVRGDLPYATGSVMHIDGGLSLPRL